MTGHAAKPLGEGLRVAVLAAGRDLLAPANGVPGGVGPLDVAAVTHSLARVLNYCIVRAGRQDFRASGDGLVWSGWRSRWTCRQNTRTAASRRSSSTRFCA